MVKESKHYIYGVHIFHSAMKPKLSNPCAIGFCSHLCLLRGESYTCACPEDMVLGADKKSCFGIKRVLFVTICWFHTKILETNKKQMLILGVNNLLLHVHHQKLGKHDISQLPSIAKEVSALTYDSLHDTLIVSDNQTRRILTFSLRNMTTSEIPVGELGQVTSMDFGK